MIFKAFKWIHLIMMDMDDKSTVFDFLYLRLIESTLLLLYLLNNDLSHFGWVICRMVFLSEQTMRNKTNTAKFQFTLLFKTKMQLKK